MLGCWYPLPNDACESGPYQRVDVQNGQQSADAQNDACQRARNAIHVLRGPSTRVYFLEPFLRCFRDAYAHGVRGCESPPGPVLLLFHT